MSYGWISDLANPMDVYRIRGCASRTNHEGGRGPWPALKDAGDWPLMRFSLGAMSTLVAPSTGYHCTIAYLGDSSDLDVEERQFLERLDRDAGFLNATQPVMVRATHLAVWRTDDGYVIAALLEGEWPHIWRGFLREWLGGRLNTQDASRFMFQPHVTIGYVATADLPPHMIYDTPQPMEHCLFELQPPRLLVSDPGAT